MNWIAENKLLAFGGPKATPEEADCYSVSVPSTYIEYFKEHNVTDVVRLNKVTVSFAALTFSVQSLCFLYATSFSICNKFLSGNISTASENLPFQYT